MANEIPGPKIGVVSSPPPRGVRRSTFGRQTWRERQQNGRSPEATGGLERQRRMLLRHGFVFLFIAPCLGLAIMFLPNPRGWLAAHVTAFLTSFILAIVGLIWRELRLTDGQRKRRG